MGDLQASLVAKDNCDLVGLFGLEKLGSFLLGLIAGGCLDFQFLSVVKGEITVHGETSEVELGLDGIVAWKGDVCQVWAKGY